MRLNMRNGSPSLGMTEPYKNAVIPSEAEPESMGYVQDLPEAQSRDMARSGKMWK
jgi:hypothetical protein